jgi:calcium release-activated calcium channel protein 1
MDFRVEERDWWHLEHLWRQENRKWRVEDVEQRVLENARWIWLRYAEKNRRDVEEKSEQLKSISNLSALIAGFAVVAFVELQFHDPETRPTHVGEVLIVAYAVTTATVTALMLNSMVLCSFLLCSILRNGKTYVSEAEEADYLFRCRSFSANYKPGDAPPTPKRSFEAFWETRCEDDWKHAFRMFTCGVPVFLVNIACVAWLKFHYSPAAAGATTAVAVVATAGWAKTQNNWGWHVARGGRAAERGPPCPRARRANPRACPSTGTPGRARAGDTRAAGSGTTTARTETAPMRLPRRGGTCGRTRWRLSWTPSRTRGEAAGDANDGDDGAGILDAAAADSSDPRGGGLSADAEGDFVRRASPRARDIARRSSLENAFDGSRRVAGGQAEAEEPFAATAEALRRAES